jgi:hypothetical protein
MSNSKISALTAAATVVGTEVLPIVQSSATVKATVANLTPGLATITAAKGGTGQTSYAVGDIIYADTTTTLAKLADVATGNALISGGVSTVPSWGKIGLTTHVSGILPVANGGTNASTASITSFNNITGYTASGATGTTSTNLVFSTSPTLVTPTLGAALATSIKFGSGTVLSTYEEGTWTPTLGGTATYTAQKGSYIKIGRLVLVSFDITILLIGTGSTTTISGLPFTVGSQTSPKMEQAPGSCGYFASLAVNVYSIVPYASATTTTVLFVSNSALGGTATVNPAIFGNSARIQGAISYIAVS